MINVRMIIKKAPVKELITNEKPWLKIYNLFTVTSFTVRTVELAT
jgi:hypothetical protein